MDNYLRCHGVPQASAQGDIYEPVPAGDAHLWRTRTTQGISGNTRHYVQIIETVLVSTRKGVREALLDWVPVMWPLSQAFGVCLGAEWIALWAPRLSWIVLQRLQREFTCPGHNQTPFWLSLCLSPELVLCPFDRVLVGYFSGILRKGTVFLQK